MPRATRLAALAVALAGVATGCAHREAAAVATSATARPPEGTPGPPPAAEPDAARVDPARLAAIRDEVDRLLKAQGELLWEVWTRGSAPDLDPGAAEHAGLLSRDTLAFVREARDRAAGDQHRALSLLHAFLVGEHLARAAGAPPRPPTLTWDGSAVLAQRVPALLGAEPVVLRRAALERAWVEAQRRQAPAMKARWKAIADAARGLGYGSLLTLAIELRGSSADALAKLAEGVLADTDDVYRGAMDALARRELGRGLEEVRGRDVPRLLRAGEDRGAFSAPRTTSNARDTFTAVGLDLSSRAGVVLDGEARPRKDPRALALPVVVPGDVRLSFTSGGGAPGVRGLLHELGVTAFYASITSPEMEFQRLGTVTSEAWADLFAELIGDPAWLAERAGVAEPHLAPLVQAAAARRLHRARLLAARILDEIARVREPDRAAAGGRALLGRAMLRPVDADELELFLLDRDPLLESADALRATLLAARAEAFLSGRAAPPWWRSKESGAWLTATFAAGSRLTPSELARALGAEGIDGAALAGSARSRMAAAGLRIASAP